MPRSTIFVVTALVLAAIAAAIVYTSGALNNPSTVIETSPRSPSNPPASGFQQIMSEVKSVGGVALTFANTDAANWRVGDANRLERFKINGSDVAFSRITTGQPLDVESTNWASQGVSATFSVDFNNFTNGKKVEVGILAKAAASNPVKKMYAIYATQQAGNSGWREIVLGDEFAVHTFQFDVPVVTEPGYTNPPILVVRASNGQAIELLGVYVKLAK